MFKTLDDQMLVAEQIAPDDVIEAKAQGVTKIVNNRPDGEAPGQPAGEAIRAAAQAAGLDYVALPMGHGPLDIALIEGMAAALDDGARVLAFCRSGTRSTILWGLARALRGGDVGDLMERAAAAGYDLGPYARTMAGLAGSANGGAAGR